MNLTLKGIILFLQQPSDIKYEVIPLFFLQLNDGKKSG